MNKERPILFSGPMVNAILEGRKTVTRRVIKPQLSSRFDEGRGPEDAAAGYPFVELDDGFFSAKDLCPYGQEGDRLWVRETFTHYRPFGEETQPDAPIIYRADEDKCGQYPAVIDGRSVLVSNRNPWKPSIFMPRWASRITLEVTGVRVEQVQDISEEDAIAEGIDHAYANTIGAFADLWDTINAKRGYSWESNPYVWVIGFTRIVV